MKLPSGAKVQLVVLAPVMIVLMGGIFWWGYFFGDDPLWAALLGSMVIITAIVVGLWLGLRIYYRGEGR